MLTMIRLMALIKKELLAVVGDKQGLRLLIIPVFLQLLVFPFAATLEVKNNAIGVFDEDGQQVAREIIQRLTRTPSFERVEMIRDEAAMRRAIDRQDVLLVLRFSPDFSRSAQRGQPRAIQAIFDGRRSNSGQIAVNYVQQILAGAQQVVGNVPLSTVSEAGKSTVELRHWYNPNLDYFRFILPSLVALITTLSALVVTAMSVAREREQGTLEQLLVSPLTPWMIFVGKAVPALVVAMVQASIILAGSIFGYGVQFQGSLLLLYACIVPYVFALVGIGLFISALSSTQQQAFLGVFLFTMPGILLSGYVTPVHNMPALLQTVTWANPIRHFIVIAKGIYLKAAVAADFPDELLALVLIGLVSMTMSLLLFQRRLA